MNYTCNSCSLAFPTPEDQRSHMKSDWHRYNLKRRVAQLPAIDEDLFNQKVASLTIAEENEAEEKKKSEKQLTKKEIRRREKEALQEKKRKLLETARQAMLAKMRDGTLEKESEKVSEESNSKTEETKPVVEERTEEAKTEEAQPEELTQEQLEERIMAEKIQNKVDISPTTCLFCHAKYNSNFASVDENVEHMRLKHGLYIPESKFLINREGLLQYLAEKIGLGNICLCCSYQGKSLEAVREHMINKRHMRIPYESENEKLEISDFYDFSSTYEDSEVVEELNGVDEEDWEDVSGDEEDYDSDELPPNSGALLQNGHELILPSGAVIGHRSLARYYRQNLAPERILSEGQGTVIAAETRSMLTVRDKQELATQKRAWNREVKRNDVNDRRAAKFINNQPHFRDPLLQ